MIKNKQNYNLKCKDCLESLSITFICALFQQKNIQQGWSLKNHNSLARINIEYEKPCFCEISIANSWFSLFFCCFSLFFPCFLLFFLVFLLVFDSQMVANSLFFVSFWINYFETWLFQHSVQAVPLKKIKMLKYFVTRPVLFLKDCIFNIRSPHYQEASWFHNMMDSL